MSVKDIYLYETLFWAKLQNLFSLVKLLFSLIGDSLLLVKNSISTDENLFRPVDKSSSQVKGIIFSICKTLISQELTQAI